MEHKTFFLSSVFGDLCKGFREERKYISRYLNDYKYYHVTSYDDGRGGGGTSLTKSLRGVIESDYIILFIGTEYGSLRKKSDAPKEYQKYFGDQNELSLTHLEFRVALDHKKEILPLMSSASTDKHTQAFVQEIIDLDLIYIDMDETWSLFPKILECKSSGIGEVSDREQEVYCKYLTMSIIENIHFNDHNKNTITDVSLECSLPRIFSEIDKDGEHYIIVSEIHKSNIKSLQDIQDEILGGTLDQKYLYHSAESVLNWQKWVEGKNNKDDKDDKEQSKTSKQELQSLEYFLDKSVWKDIIKHTDTIVDLGVGAGEKTVKVLNSIKGEFKNKELNLVVVDHSHYMLELAIHNITYEIPKSDVKYQIDGFRKDFMKLEKSKHRLQGSGSEKTIFMMMGGTFGNINESDFLKNLSGVSKKGDIFVIGVFLLPNHSTKNELKKIKQEIKEDYNNKKVHDMFSPSLMELGFKFNDVSSDWNDIERPTVPNTEILKFYGDVQSIIGNNSVVLKFMSTKRYVAKDLSKYIEDEYGFKCILETTNDDGNFGYFGFECKG